MTDWQGELAAGGRKCCLKERPLKRPLPHGFVKKMHTRDKISRGYIWSGRVSQNSNCSFWMMYFKSASGRRSRAQEVLAFPGGLWTSACLGFVSCWGGQGTDGMVAGLGQQDILFGCSAWKSYTAETHSPPPVLFPGHLWISKVDQIWHNGCFFCNIYLETWKSDTWSKKLSLKLKMWGKVGMLLHNFTDFPCCHTRVCLLNHNHPVLTLASLLYTVMHVISLFKYQLTATREWEVFSLTCEC